MFDGSRTADRDGRQAASAMLHELMREFGVQPERTLMIGDTTHDLQMALNAGCASVGVSYGAHEPEAFDGAQAPDSWRIGACNCMTGCGECLSTGHDNASLVSLPLGRLAGRRAGRALRCALYRAEPAGPLRCAIGGRSMPT